MNRLRTWFRNEPAVQRAYYVTGTADHVVIVIARDIQEFDALVSEMMATANLVMRAIKRGLMVPIDEGRTCRARGGVYSEVEAMERVEWRA